MSTPENFVPFMPEGVATPETAAQTIRDALDLLGPNGEHWIKGELRDGLGDFCVVGALEQAAPDYSSYDLARRTLRDVVGGKVDRWNNRAESFTEVQLAMSAAFVRLSPSLPSAPPGFGASGGGIRGQL